MCKSQLFSNSCSWMSKKMQKTLLRDVTLTTMFHTGSTHEPKSLHGGLGSRLSNSEFISSLWETFILTGFNPLLFSVNYGKVWIKQVCYLAIPLVGNVPGVQIYNSNVTDIVTLHCVCLHVNQIQPALSVIHLLNWSLQLLFSARVNTPLHLFNKYDK